MTILFVILCVLSVCNVKVCREGFNKDYIDRDQTNCIKGIFILVVFITHINQYISASGYEYTSLCDKFFPSIVNHIGQLLVVMFLFYSGYGVREGIKRKGNAYIQSIPKHRVLTTLLNFDIAVLAFAIVDILLSIKITPVQVLLSLTGWETLGNSNWYIFVILLCYLSVYVAYRVTPPRLQNTVYQIVALLILCSLCIVALYFTRGSWWYNTMLSFPAGYIYSQYKNELERFFQSHYAASLITISIIFAILHVHPWFEAVSYNLQSVTFSFIVVLLTMKIKIGNKWLLWFGVNLFPLYIYQRIPMIAIRELLGNDIIKNYTAVYVVLCLLITIMIVRCYKYWQIKLK